MGTSRNDSSARLWLAAAVLLVVGGAAAMYFVTRPARPAEVRTTSAIHAVSGAGVLKGPEARFTWNRDPRANLYRLELYDPTSNLLAAALLRDTTVLASAVLPDSAHIGVWRVVPVSPGGTELPPTTSRFIRN